MTATGHTRTGKVSSFNECYRGLSGLYTGHLDLEMTQKSIHLLKMAPAFQDLQLLSFLCNKICILSFKKFIAK